MNKVNIYLIFGNSEINSTRKHKRNKKIVNIIYIPLIKLLYFWMISSFELLDIYIIFLYFTLFSIMIDDLCIYIFISFYTGCPKNMGIQ